MRWTGVCLQGATLVAASMVSAATLEYPRPDIHILSDEPLSDNPNLHAVSGITRWPLHGRTLRHYHAGDEYAIVLEGAVAIENDGESRRVFKAGQSYHNRRGIVHVASNAYEGESKLVFVLISDRDAPLQVPPDK